MKFRRSAAAVRVCTIFGNDDAHPPGVVKAATLRALAGLLL
jgi:hypothetical protein